jgi:hypothetical protein
MMRFLYIVSPEDTGQSEQIFAWLKRDMATATVLLTFDRRRGERRNRLETVPAERRRADRRRRDVQQELDRVGWARVRLE